MLSGIRLRKDIEIITPAAKASRLKVNLSDGFFSTPISEPITGPITDINTIVNIEDIFQRCITEFIIVAV
jgi:hypothetical protein